VSPSGTGRSPIVCISQNGHGLSGWGEAPLEFDWQPTRTKRWHDRRSRLAATISAPGTVLNDVITHPEMFTAAGLLILSDHPRASKRRT